MPISIKATETGRIGDLLYPSNTLTIALFVSGHSPRFAYGRNCENHFSARISKQKGYRVTKQLRTRFNGTRTNVRDGEWRDIRRSEK